MSAAAAMTLASELWLSFAGLVRAYAASAALNANVLVEVVATEDAVAVMAGQARLALRINAAAGSGEWELRTASTTSAHGRFALLPEGRIELDGAETELDHAAIDLVALTMRAAKLAGRNA